MSPLYESMKKIRIAITTGDIDGVGFEIAAKALHQIGPQKNVQFILWRSPSASSKYLRLIDQTWTRRTTGTLNEALSLRTTGLIDLCSELSPALWVEATAKACFQNVLQGMATGPLSKTSIKEAGFSDLGHTDILKRISKAKSVHMGFLGEKFNVVLATGHIPLAEVSQSLNYISLQKALINTNLLREKLPKVARQKPIAVLGLNPHAGESGLIGKEEISLFKKLKSFAAKNNIPCDGPLVPDAAFMNKNWKKYSAFLALYHDQGLIPFKAIHGQDSGVHISLGIPFVRTSVDHGTAKDIFGLDCANPNSMIDAIRWAVKLARL